jgi:hypothetical protein
MTTAVVSVLAGLVIAILVIGTPYWLTHRHMRPQHDPDEALAYQQATARSAGDIAGGKPGRSFWHGGRAARRWQAARCTGNWRLTRLAPGCACGIAGLVSLQPMDNGKRSKSADRFAA